MSRNLCTDSCDCGHLFKITDFMGQPVEFRKYYDYAPVMGTKLTCPECGKVYFGWMRSDHKFWADPQDAFKDEIDYGNGHVIQNRNKGKFVTKSTFLGKDHIEETGHYQIDLSYYESYNDEGEGVDTDEPRHLLTDDDTMTRWYHNEQDDPTQISD